jgi:aspartate carbamoyltransferase catalytic subunit
MKQTASPSNPREEPDLARDTDSTYRWPHRCLIGLEDLPARDIRFLLQTALGLKDVSTRSVKKVPALRGKVVVNLFFEDSTRTRRTCWR